MFLALDEEVAADVQHLGPPAPVLRGLRAEPLHERFERLVAVGELGVVVRSVPAAPDAGAAAFPGRVCRTFSAFWMASLNCFARGGQRLLDVEFQEAALMEVDLGQDPVERQDAAA